MKPLRLLVYGEGPTDYGWISSTGEWKAGPVIFLLQKCAKEFEIELEIHYVAKSEIDGAKRIKLGARRLRGLSGKGIPAAHFAVYALEHDYLCGVFYCDTDKVMEGKNTRESDCRKHFRKIQAEVIAGFSAVENSSWKGVAMIAMKMIECWLMADASAYRKSFGKLPDQCPLPSKPELIWGEKSDGGSDYPKYYIGRVLQQYHLEPDRDIFNEIAENMILSVLREKCPISFGQFWEDFQKTFVN